MACTANIFWCQWPDILWDWVELGGSAPGADLVHSSPIGDVSVWANESVRSSWGLQDLLWIHVLIDALRRPRGYAALWRTSSAIQRPSILSDVQHYGGGGMGKVPCPWEWTVLSLSTDPQWWSLGTYMVTPLGWGSAAGFASGVMAGASSAPWNITPAASVCLHVQGLLLIVSARMCWHSEWCFCCYPDLPSSLPACFPSQSVLPQKL